MWQRRSTTHGRLAAFAAVVVVATCAALAWSPAARAAPERDLGALVGRWQLDPSRTHMGRYGPDGQNMVRDPTFTFIFSPDPQGLKIAVYAKYPQSAPDRTMLLIPDGKAHACQDKAACLTAGGDASEQSYVYHQVDAHFVVRTFFIKGQISEYSTYGVSADGNTFTMMAWSPATPYWQNIQVFIRQP
jgi:hypothetical protein